MTKIKLVDGMFKKNDPIRFQRNGGDKISKGIVFAIFDDNTGFEVRLETGHKAHPKYGQEFVILDKEA